jgi:hypothetical protein
VTLVMPRQNISLGSYSFWSCSNRTSPTYLAQSVPGRRVTSPPSRQVVYFAKALQPFYDLCIYNIVRRVIEGRLNREAPDGRSRGPMSTRRQELKRASLLVALVGSVWLLGGAAIAADSPSVPPGNDAQITDQVTAALRQIDPTLGRRLVVMTENGVVTLTGQTGPGFARSALQAAKSVPGVTKVRNQMSVLQ